ncbi:tetratricopeptide repeat protein [Streptomyces sp. SP18BB07]|uniref:tetratricopeptide repeat protein n=1 Tax=Streptomyces sp. SP18BB07 TaxID=3002522 RepID=UPI002E771278|nr:tetratricopeptide repeat protein [Streptomyces sp. SP18BB07]MEE1765327.1 tetratricopeptide repeat protein [Streptomyces sp. SP18BB07]
MDRARVVAIDGGAGPGTGYVLAPRLVLTSAHVAPEPGIPVTLFKPGQPDQWEATVIWRGTPGGRDDAALIRVDGTSWVPPRSPPVRWGRLVTHRPGTPCEAWGVPEIVQRLGRATDTLQPSGTLNPGDRYVGNRYVMNLDQHPPAAARDGSSPWGGMSGAALFCGELLAGVIAADPAGRAHASLEAIPAYVLLNDPGFRAALAEHAPEAATVLEPVEWQHLAEAATPTATIGSPATLLRARQETVPFRGRAALLDDLDAFAREEGFGALLLHGPGGQGKTRVAQRLTASLTGRGWATLWLRSDASREALAVLAAAAVPLLVVVDYAETRTAQLVALLDAVARHSGANAVKLLLLARGAGDWWQDLQAVSRTAEDLLDGADTVALRALEPEPGDSRLAAYQEAVRAYAQHMPRVRGWQHHDWPALASRLLAPAHRSGTGAELDRPGLGSALTLHMTALADLLDAAVQKSPRAGAAEVESADGVEDRLLVHERRYWTNSATACALHPALTFDTLTDALAAAFLFGADSRPGAQTLLRRVPGLADQSVDRLGAVRGWIAALYPPVPGAPWGTLQPDRLTERFIGRHLQQDPTLVDHLIPGATETQADRLLTLYARAAAHPVFRQQLDAHLTAMCVRHGSLLALPAIDAATRTETPQPLLDALHRISDDPETTLPDLRRLNERLPHTSHNLAPFTAHLARRMADQYRSLARHDPERLPDLAHSLHSLAIRLGAVGQRPDGLAAISEAVGIYRELVQARPDVFLLDLLAALNNLAHRLAEMGRLDEAVAAAGEAAEKSRELLRAEPDDASRMLSMSLSNLYTWLRHSGRAEEGLAAVTEAVEINRRLFRLRPDTDRNPLANSLLNLSIGLSEAGRIEEALTAVTEAVRIHRELARDRPDMYLHDLARSLNSYSVQLGEAGRREEGLAAIVESVEINWNLARHRPKVFLNPLAKGLNNLLVDFTAAGKVEEGLAVIAEAMEFYRDLDCHQPDQFLLPLLESMNRLMVWLAETGRQEEGESVAVQAMQVFHELYGYWPHERS